MELPSEIVFTGQVHFRISGFHHVSLSLWHLGRATSYNNYRRFSIHLRCAVANNSVSNIS
jgi:hypothetical protein